MRLPRLWQSCLTASSPNRRNTCCPRSAFSDIRGFGVFASCFALAFVVGSLVFVARDSEAARNSDIVDVNLKVQPVIALTMDASVLELEVSPTGAGSETSAQLVASVDTNNETGYTLNMSTIGMDTALVHTNDVNRIDSTEALFGSPGVLPVNSWGYGVGDGLEVFSRIPASSLPDEIASSEGMVAGDETLLTFGANVNSLTMSGTYANSLVFTAVTNYVPLAIKEEFKFIIDTQYLADEEYGEIGESNVPETFYMPMNGWVLRELMEVCDEYDPEACWWESNDDMIEYDWAIDWGDGSAEERFQGTVESGQATYLSDISHDYDTQGLYQITIRPYGLAANGWFDAWGGFNDEYNADRSGIRALKRIGTPLTNLMRSNDGTRRFAFMFAGAVNAEVIPDDLFDNAELGGAIDYTGEAETGLFSSMFQGTFHRFGYKSRTAKIPESLFDSLDTSGATEASNMFLAAFYEFGVSSEVETDINLIWGDADLSGISDCEVFLLTFDGMESLVGEAQRFIDEKLGGMEPTSNVGTFKNTNISDYDEVNEFWVKYEVQ